MSWYKEQYTPFTKEAIAVKRDGLLGFGADGWLDLPTDSEIRDAIKYVKKFYGIEFDRCAMTDAGYVKTNELPGRPDSWLGSEQGSVELPQHCSAECLEKTARSLNEQLHDPEFGELLVQLFEGKLSPVIAFENFDIVVGKNKAIMANALAIPVRLYILARVEQ